MVTRGRGVGRCRGRGCNVPPQPSPSSHISPPLQLSQHSPGATLATGPLTSASIPLSVPLTTRGASAFIPPFIDSSLSVPAPADPPTSNPNVVPSSGESYIETDNRELIYVVRRFLLSRVTRDIMYKVMTRMPILAST